MEDIEAEFVDSRMQDGMRRTSESANPSQKRKITQPLIDASDSGTDSDEESVVSNCSEEVIAPIVTNIDDQLPASEINTLTAIIRQFPSDILQLAPIPKAASVPPWMILNLDARTRAKVDVFQSLDFSQTFSQAQCRIVDGDVWHNIIFKRYFPPQGSVQTKALQHFPVTVARYYRSWMNVMNEVDANAAEEIRKEAFNWFDKLHWIPFPESDRMWSTKKTTPRTWMMIPNGRAAENCPRIAINAKFRDELR